MIRSQSNIIQPASFPERGIGQDFHYSAYGLTIRSELPLPEFDPIHSPCAQPSVAVRFGSGDWIHTVREQASYWHVDVLEARFWFRGVAGFRICAGAEIIVSPEPGIDNHLLRMYIEGMMMATLLYQRGLFVLHASVVRIGDDAVALLGHVGAGKSSSAAALHTRGHGVVTDDNAAISLLSSKPLVTPAFPCVKMFPAIAEALGFNSDSLHRMHSSQPKFVGRVSADFPREPVPLSKIYVLTRGTEASLAPISPAETIIELIRNSVPTRWKLCGDADHLHKCAILASRVPAFRLRTFDQLEELPFLAETIERHHIGIPCLRG